MPSHQRMEAQYASLAERNEVVAWFQAIRTPCYVTFWPMINTPAKAWQKKQRDLGKDASLERQYRN